MAKELKDINISFISLVKAGANNKEIIYKSANSENKPTYKKRITINKEQSKNGEVFGIVYSPNEIDSHGEFATADEIKKASYAFMKSLNNKNVDKEHSEVSEKAFIAQSWIVGENDPIFKTEKPGSWAVCIKVEDEDLKKSIESGEINSLSMGGVAIKEDSDFKETKKSLFDEIAKILASIKKHDKADDNGNNEEILKAVKQIADKVIKNEQNIEKLAKQNTELLEELKKSKQQVEVSKIENGCDGIV